MSCTLGDITCVLKMMYYEQSFLWSLLRNIVVCFQTVLSFSSSLFLVCLRFYISFILLIRNYKLFEETIIFHYLESGILLFLYFQKPVLNGLYFCLATSFKNSRVYAEWDACLLGLSLAHLNVLLTLSVV